MFRNGIYKVCYRSPMDDDGFAEDALAIFRGGKIIGSDRHGGVFVGGPGRRSADGEDVSVELTVPPGGELVTGMIAGPAGATLTINGCFDPCKLGQFAVVDVGGAPVEIQLSYLGPLPE